MIRNLKEQAEKIHECIKNAGTQPHPVNITLKNAYFTDASYTPNLSFSPIKLDVDRIRSVRYTVEIETLKERQVFSAQCTDVVIDYESVQKDVQKNIITNIQEVITCKLGLYRIHWATGGTSQACIYNDFEGNRWFCAANWTSGPIRLINYLQNIVGLEPIE